MRKQQGNNRARLWWVRCTRAWTESRLPEQAWTAPVEGVSPVLSVRSRPIFHRRQQSDCSGLCLSNRRGSVRGSARPGLGRRPQWSQIGRPNTFVKPARGPICRKLRTKIRLESNPFSQTLICSAVFVTNDFKAEPQAGSYRISCQWYGFDDLSASKIKLLQCHWRKTILERALTFLLKLHQLCYWFSRWLVAFK